MFKNRELFTLWLESLYDEKNYFFIPSSGVVCVRL